MFYITKQETETGKQFTKLLAKAEIAINCQKSISTKYGFKAYRGAFISIWGGLSSCLDFDKQLDKSVWGKGVEKGEFFPKKSSKLGKEILKEIAAMPCVTISDLNHCIGYHEGPPFRRIGFSFNNDGVYGFTVGREWMVEIPDDCIEVTETEYHNLFEFS